MKSTSLEEPSLIYDSGDWVVINKPPGWYSIPARDPQAPHLLEWLNEKIGKVWIVHRLDVQTSGVILFAKTEEAHQQANGWFRERKVKKTYLALAEGASPLPAFVRSDEVSGVPARTQFSVKENYSGAFLVEAHPLTGRRHQIRVHLSQAGYPILGDVAYGGRRQIVLSNHTVVVGRVALHASVLKLPNGKIFEAPIPKDFSCWLNELEGKRPST